MINSEVVKTSLQRLLPPGAHICCGPEVDAVLSDRERQSLGPVNEHRSREFANGRAYAKQALAGLGHSKVDLPMGIDRLPCWPTGVIGAISHAVQCTGKPFFAVAVAPIKLLPRLGLDIEIEASVEPGIWPLVFSPRELQTLSRTPTEWRRVSAQFLWCAKEAATKVARLPIDPIDIEIDLREVDATFTASIGAQNFALGRVGRVSALQFAVAF